MRVVLCTCPAADAGKIARALVDRGAACVNIVPGLTSVYVWKGVVTEDQESLLVVKADAARLEALRAALAEVHPYELPEWVVLPVDEALTSREYAAWVKERR